LPYYTAHKRNNENMHTGYIREEKIAKDQAA
jgi:hypothetical protein